MTDAATPELRPLNERAAALVPGQRYRITFYDCCVNGWFEGTFQHVEYTPNRPWLNEPPTIPNELVFDTGRIDVRGNWEATTIEDTT